MATQILTTTQPQIAHNLSLYEPDMYNQYSGHVSMNTSTYAPYQTDAQNQPLYGVSQQSVPSESQFRRPSSQSPNTQVHVPLGHDRTPIQHHRPSLSRTRSRSRSDLLLAYAADQSQVQQPNQSSIGLVPAQPAPTASQMFSLQSYSIQPAPATYVDPRGYFPSATPVRQSAIPDYNFPSSDQLSSFESVSRSTSHGSIAALASLNPQETIFLQNQPPQPSQEVSSMSNRGQPFPPIHVPLESSPCDFEIMASRPKPQCWDHGCNGRQFSTFSNLLRHQREKSGSAMKAVCPHCGTEFTRTTARNGHLYGGKCRGKPNPDNTSSGLGGTSDKEE